MIKQWLGWISKERNEKHKKKHKWQTTLHIGGDMAAQFLCVMANISLTLTLTFMSLKFFIARRACLHLRRLVLYPPVSRWDCFKVGFVDAFLGSQFLHSCVSARWMMTAIFTWVMLHFIGCLMMVCSWISGLNHQGLAIYGLASGLLKIPMKIDFNETPCKTNNFKLLYGNY